MAWRRSNANGPELQPLIDYYVAGCEWSMGRLDTARSRLQIAAGNLERRQGLDGASVEALVRANCAGRLAWLDAFCGNLRRSMRYATAVLTTRRADTAEIGVRFAQLATVLVHTERGEIEQAKQRLDHAVSLSADDDDPLLAAAQLLTQVRLATVTDGSLLPCGCYSKLQISAATPRQAGSRSSSRWQQPTHISRWASRAGPSPFLLACTIQRMATSRCAWPRPIGWRAIFAVRRPRWTRRGRGPPWMPWSPRCAAGCYWLNCMLSETTSRARLVESALSAAGSEALVETVREADGWLRSFLARDSRLLLRHSSFLASLATRRLYGCRAGRRKQICQRLDPSSADCP